MGLQHPTARSPARDTLCTISSRDSANDPEATLTACPFVYSDRRTRDGLVRDPYKFRANRLFAQPLRLPRHHGCVEPRLRTYERQNSQHSNDQTQVGPNHHSHHSTTHQHQPHDRYVTHLAQQPTAMARRPPSQEYARVLSELHYELSAARLTRVPMRWAENHESAGP